MRLHTDAFKHRHFYTQTLLHTDAFTHGRFYTETLLHTDAFTHKPHRRLYAQSRLHTDAFTHGCFYTQTLLHTNTLTHRHFYTQTLLHANAFTHSRVYTQTLLHTDAFTHKHFVSQTLLHTKAFTHKHFDTQKLLHTKESFYTQTLAHRQLHTDACTHLLRNILSNYWCGMHRTCKNTSVKPDRKWWMTMKKNSFYVLARCNCSIWRSRVIQIAKTVQALKKVKPRKWTACSTVQTEFCRYTSGRLPMHHQRMWASSLAVIPQTLSLPSAELEVLHLSRWFTHTPSRGRVGN